MYNIHHWHTRTFQIITLRNIDVSGGTSRTLAIHLMHSTAGASAESSNPCKSSPSPSCPSILGHLSATSFVRHGTKARVSSQHPNYTRDRLPCQTHQHPQRTPRTPMQSLTMSSNRQETIRQPPRPRALRIRGRIDQQRNPDSYAP